MFKKTLISLAVASSVGLTGCLSGGDEGANANPTPNYVDKETAYDQYFASFEGKVWPVFNPTPGETDVPLPNDLIYGSNGDGTFTVADTQPPVTTALNSLSGASTIAPIDIKMSGTIDGNVKGPSSDPAELAQQNVFLIELDYASESPLQALSATEAPKPGLFQDFAVTVKRLYDPTLEKQTDFIRILPVKPLKPGKRYIVAILDEVTADGQPIVSSPTYTTMDSGEDSPEGTTLAPGLDAVRSLIDKLWEPIAAGTVNGLRSQVSGNPISQANIALSYSFTTSNDEQVLKYIANPKYWLGDQVLSAARLGITKKITGAAKHFAYLNDPENNDGLSPADWDLNDDGVVDSSDFDVNSDGELTPADFIIADRNSDGTVDATDFGIALAPNSSKSFGYVDLKAAVDATPVSVALDNTNLSGCDSAPFEVPTPQGNVTVPDQALCVGSIFSGALAGAGINLPQPESAGPDGVSVSFAAEDVESATSVSAVLGSITGSSNVNVTQGSITLPYYLGIPDGSSTAAAAEKIQSTSWNANNDLAMQLNGFLKGAGFDLELPQGTGASDVVNSFYPFPEKTGDLTVPMLVMYPKALDTNGDQVPDTPFDPEGNTSIPVVIYQHGITTDRSAALTFGSALAAQGIAVVAIDQPLHGVDGTAITNADPVNSPTGSMTGWAGLLLKSIETKLVEAGLVTAGDVANPTFISALVQSALENSADTFNTAVNSSNLNATAKAQITAQTDILYATVRDSGSTVAGLQPSFTGQGLNPDGATERHFGYGSNECSAVTAMHFAPANYSPDDARPASGDLFINLQNFINNRDLLRQGSVDLMTLRASIKDIAPAFDESNVYFVGHSLGTLNGGAFVGAVNVSNRTDLQIEAANLLTPVAGTVRMLENSPEFAPKILAGIKAGNPGLTQEVSSLQTFFNVLQASLDTVDPINFAEELSSNALLSQIDGDEVVINDGANALSDDYSETVCGTVITGTLNGSVSPLSGSAPLAAMAGANTLDSGNTPAALSAFVRFTGGVHSTPVLPASASEQAVFGQMVAQTISLIQTGGTAAAVVTTSPATSDSVVDQ